jgi:HAD superfamily phosphoserine phosphatase-like hydrolase
MSKTKVALIDLDGTLLRRRSSEHSFFLFLVLRGKIGPLRLGRFFFSFYGDALRKGLRQAIGMNAGYLRGETPQTVEAWAREYGRTFLRNAIPPRLKERIRGYRGAGFRIILLSGTLQAIANEIGDQLGAEVVIGRELEVAGGTYTGRRAGIYPYGRQKVEALFRAIDPDEIDWERSLALADRLSDLPVFGLVGRPVAVHPQKSLRRLARERGWDIIG